jgi:hypothetical protein
VRRRTGQEGRQREEMSLLWMVDYVLFLFSYLAKSARVFEGSETRSPNIRTSARGE